MWWPAWVRLNVPETEDSIVFWFQPVAETLVPSELRKQSSVIQGAGFSLKPKEEHLKAQAG